MKLTWYGHSCFLLESEEGSAVLDPYAPGSVPGLRLPPLRADAVVCSHGHRDHGYAEGVTLSGKTTRLQVETLETFHDSDGGRLRGSNTVHILQAEGLRLAHLGDLGHPLSPEQIAALGRIDVLMIPVGGYYTIGPETAAAIVRALRPGLTLPMHYRGEGFGYDVIGPVEDFVKLCGPVRRLAENVLRPESMEPPLTVLLRCPTEN